MLIAIGPDLACTLDAAEAGDRLSEWQALAAEATGRQMHAGETQVGLRLTFAPDIDLRAMADLVARESGCCAFLSFVITVDPSAATLVISGPPEAVDIIDALIGVAA